MSEVTRENIDDVVLAEIEKRPMHMRGLLKAIFGDKPGLRRCHPDYELVARSLTRLGKRGVIVLRRPNMVWRLHADR